jgi:hypothetical protein
MPRPRTTIAGLMLLVLGCALGLAAGHLVSDENLAVTLFRAFLIFVPLTLLVCGAIANVCASLFTPHKPDGPPPDTRGVSE